MFYQQTGIFYPVYWANRDKKVTTPLFDEIEYMDNYAHWIDALKNNRPVILADIANHDASVSPAEQQSLEALQMQVREPCGELKDGRNICFRMFGEPKIHTQGSLAECRLFDAGCT